MALLPVLLLPLLGAVALMFVDRTAVKGIKMTALIFSILTFIASLAAFLGFDHGSGDFQYLVDWTWITSLDAGFRIGADGMAILLVMLTTVIMPVAILTSFSSIKKSEKLYYVMLMLLQFGMTGVFLALDTFLFYVFWEVILIPMYFIIGIWGGQNRIYASIKFFLYTMFGSLLMLIAIIWLGFHGDPSGGGFTANLLTLRDVGPSIPMETQQWLFLAFALSFAIKVPLFPLHTWLPDAHVQAPTAGSVILAGVLLKLGTYGLIRFNLELFPQASYYFADAMCVLAVIGVIYGALVAMVQTDIKKLVAYSSVSHMGFIVLGIFSMTTAGLQGAIIQMVNHGLSTGMLFLCVGALYERRHTREIEDYGGVMARMPRFGVIFGIAMLASVGLPGLNGFVGEFLTLLGAYNAPALDGNVWYTVFAASGVILAAVYLLKMYNGVMFGPINNTKNESLTDMTRSEAWQLVPLAALCFWIGLFPNTFLDYSKASTEQLVEKVESFLPGGSGYAMEAAESTTAGTSDDH